MRRLVVSFHVTVANYEYLVYWRFYQDGNIECEVRATGIMVTTRVRRASSRPTARSSTSARTRRSTSTSSSRGSTSTSTAPPTRSSRRPSELAARAPTTRTASRCAQRVDAAAHRARGRCRTSTGPPSAAGRSSTRASRNALGTPVAYKLVPGASDPADARTRLARCCQRARAICPHAVGHAVRRRRALAVRGVLDAEREGRGAAGRGRRETGRSRTPTWCSGTSSASTT